MDLQLRGNADTLPVFEASGNREIRRRQ